MPSIFTPQVCPLPASTPRRRYCLHLEDGTAYRQTQTYNLPSHNSKMVLSIVKIGPPFPAYVYCITN